MFILERGRWEPKMATVHLSHLFIARETGTRPADTGPRGYLRLATPRNVYFVLISSAPGERFVFDRSRKLGERLAPSARHTRGRL